MSLFYSSSSSSSSVLEICVNQILQVIKPSQEDVTARTQIINDFKAIVASIGTPKFRGASVEIFGSFVSNLYTKWGDLDITIQLPESHWNALEDIKVALQRRGGFRIINFLPGARVPILAVTNIHNNISCDISINNWSALINSKFLSCVAQIDDRFRDIVLLIKEWAKSYDINNPSEGTLNSYSICLLVIFHFQTCVPAIIPPLKEIYTGNVATDFRGGRAINGIIHETCTANVERFKRNNLTNVNRSSLSELLLSFFHKYSTIKMMASDRVVCTYTGQWEQKRNYFRRSTPIIIEDPINRPENAARAVRYMSDLNKISEAFVETNRKLLSASCDRSSLISSLMRREISSRIIT